jgi:hypothetical protein
MTKLCRLPITLARASRAAAALALAAGLAGCGVNDELASAMVQPGKYTLYTCQDMTLRAREAAARERELKDLMEKAEKGSGGGLVNTLAYRNDYLTARGEVIELERAAAAKNCGTAFKSVSERAVR